jgi:hypothetical protein
MILLCEHPAPCGMRERPINTCGLAGADQGQPRAALEANDLWIGYVGAQHPLELLVAAVQILFAKLGIVAHRVLRRLHQQRT